MLSFRPEQTAELLHAELLGIALLFGSCRVPPAHCCAPANKSVLFLTKKISSDLAQVVETNDYFFTFNMDYRTGVNPHLEETLLTFRTVIIMDVTGAAGHQK